MTDTISRKAAIEAAVNAITCGGYGVHDFEQIAADDVTKAIEALPAASEFVIPPK